MAQAINTFRMATVARFVAPAEPITLLLLLSRGAQPRRPLGNNVYPEG
jgi:hypothetical protein